MGKLSVSPAEKKEKEKSSFVSLPGNLKYLRLLQTFVGLLLLNFLFCIQIKVHLPKYEKKILKHMGVIGKRDFVLTKAKTLSRCHNPQKTDSSETFSQQTVSSRDPPTKRFSFRFHVHQECLLVITRLQLLLAFFLVCCTSLSFCFAHFS